MHGGAEVDLAETILRQPGVLAAIVAGSLLFGVFGWLVAAWLGWSRTATALAGCGLALALGVTLARPGFRLSRADLHHPLAACVNDAFSLDGGLQLLNFAMLMPFALFATLASRRPLTTLACCALLSGGIEVIQAATSVGVCQKQDFLNNTVGAVLAVVVGWGLLALIGRTRSQVQPR